MVDDSESQVNSNCIGCHGDLAQVAEKGKGKGHVNPHASHVGRNELHGLPPRPRAVGGLLQPVPHLRHGDGGRQCGEERRARPGRPAPHKVESTDIVVVGGGAAGYTAAITAHDLGAKVILLEKQPITGGNSMLAAGGMNAAGTKFQAAKGIKDSPELMFQDTMKGGKNVSDPELVRVLASNSAAAVDWLTSIGADISDVGRLGGASVSRAHRPTGGADRRARTSPAC